MKKLLYLLILTALVTGCKKTIQSEEIYKSENLKIIKLSDHIYEHISYLQTQTYGKVSCNGMIVTYRDEAVVFDTPADDETSKELIGWIINTLGAKITAIIPTHYHADNLGGLNEFHSNGIPSYALQKTIKITQENDLIQPQNSFDNFLELKVGNEKVYVDFLGGGHTCDNTIGYFPAEDILFGGCLIKENGAGKGNLEEARIDEWPETIRKIKTKYPNTRWIIPGHGKAGGIELLEYTINLFE